MSSVTRRLKVIIQQAVSSFYTVLGGGGRWLEGLTLKVEAPLSVEVICPVEL